MKINKNRTLILYTLSSLIVFILATLISSIILIRMTSLSILYTHTSFYPIIITGQIEKHPDIVEFMSNENVSEVEALKADKYFNEVMELGFVFRIKVWNKEGTILWSDEKQLINENYSDNHHFLEALNGNIDYEFEDASKEEHVQEQGVGKFLELYIPIKYNSEIIGVIEIYEKNDDIIKSLTNQKQAIWFIAIISFFLLYLILFYIFYQANMSNIKVNNHLVKTQDLTIYALAYQAELRDLETGQHISRTSEFVKILAEELQKNPDYSRYLNDEYIADLVRSAPLHDIGKVGISDEILRKKGKLTDREFKTMQQHCLLGAETLRMAESKLGFQTFLRIAINISESHHEKWNGSGYPHGLKGSEIPISGRIMALADVYDALRSQRVYKPGFDHNKSMEIIIQEKDEHFDPDVVDAFVRRNFDFEKKFIELSKEEVFSPAELKKEMLY